MPTLYTQRGNTILFAQAGVLVLILAVGLFMNHQSKQKLEQIRAANASSSSTNGEPATHTPYNASQAAQAVQEAIRQPQQSNHISPDMMDRNIQHMNNYNRQLVLFSNQQSELLDEWHRLQQKSYGQDRLAIRDTLDKMVNVYEQLDKLATPECKRKEKHQWMRDIEENINKLNVSDSGPIVRFDPVPTPDVVAYDCFASMPPTPKQ